MAEGSASESDAEWNDADRSSSSSSRGSSDCDQWDGDDLALLDEAEKKSASGSDDENEEGSAGESDADGVIDLTQGESSRKPRNGSGAPEEHKKTFSIFDRQVKTSTAPKKKEVVRNPKKSLLSNESYEAQRVERRRQQEMLAYKYFPSEGGP